jgi:hypothetical protein
MQQRIKKTPFSSAYEYDVEKKSVIRAHVPQFTIGTNSSTRTQDGSYTGTPSGSSTLHAVLNSK